MLTKRIIPCLDVRNGRVVKGKKFKDIVDVDDPATLGKFYSDSGADELVFYDITASNEERKTSLEFVKRVAEEINIPKDLIACLGFLTLKNVPTVALFA